MWITAAVDYRIKVIPRLLLDAYMLHSSGYRNLNYVYLRRSQFLP